MKYIINIIHLLFLAIFLFLLAKGKVMLWFAIFAISLIASTVFGRVYCGYICPMNTLMIPVEWLSKKMNLQTSNTPKWLKNGYFAWIALIISIVAMLVSKSFLHIELPILSFWIIISVLITLRYEPAIFHNLICPFGTLQRSFGRFSKFSERVRKDSCIGCKLCEKTCPSNAIVVSTDDNRASIDTALCHQCTNCVQVCPTYAIHYRRSDNCRR